MSLPEFEVDNVNVVSKSQDHIEETDYEYLNEHVLVLTQDNITRMLLWFLGAYPT